MQVNSSKIRSLPNSSRKTLTYQSAMGSLDRSPEVLHELTRKVEQDGIEFVRFEVGDMSGVSRCMVVPSGEAFQQTLYEGKGMALCTISMDESFNVVEGTGHASSVGFPNGLFLPDPATYRPLPWLQNTALLLTEPSRGGAPVTSYPRYIARRQLDRLAEMGYSLLSAHEFEFYVVDPDNYQPIHTGNYLSSMSAFVRDDLLYAITRALQGIGIRVDSLHTEVSPGQVEITYRPKFGIRAADNAHMYRTAIKEIAQKRGYIASFMTKPWPNQCGNSSHFNHSLWDVEGKRNVMNDPTTELGISEVAQHWIAGILAHAPAISFLMAPTPNCQKRFKPGTFAPTNATWGIDNRTCALRMKVGNEAGTYLENRMPGSGSNPYLTLAATVAAGMDGISKKLPLPARVTVNAYSEADVPPGTQNLPGSLQGAMEAFRKDAVMTEAFGAEFCKAFTAIKLHEIQWEKEALEKGDVDWEFKKYFKVM